MNRVFRRRFVGLRRLNELGENGLHQRVVVVWREGGEMVLGKELESGINCRRVDEAGGRKEVNQLCEKA